ncbi:MAG: DUF4280 domain-containing protein [bacterium]|nr:DUF4280 domain-containing protein [bacterium]
MGFCVCAGAMCACSFGAAPSALIVTPENRVLAGGVPLATIMDYIPLKNILPFGMCSSIANPQVAAATAAALGVLTPMPCVPAVMAPWMPGAPTVLAANKPVLNADGKAVCMWGGIIQITNPGNGTVLVP